MVEGFVQNQEARLVQERLREAQPLAHAAGKGFQAGSLLLRESDEFQRFGDAACEAKVKEDTKATIRLIPIEHKDTEGAPCIVCAKPARHIAVFGRAY